MSTEIVNFGWKGLTELKAEVRDTGKAMDDVRKSNAKLTKDLSSGGFERHAKRLAAVRKELVGVRLEQDRLQRMAQKQSMIGTYGRTLGTAGYYGQRLAQSRIGGMVSGIGGGISGGLGVLGVGLGVGALASRGFAGTAAAARADAALDRLGRHVASDLAPALERLTNLLNTVNDSKAKVEAGVGTIKDRAISLSANPYVLGAAGLYAYKAGFGGILSDARAAGGVARFAGSRLAAGAAGSPGPLAAIAAGGYMIHRGMELGDEESRINALSRRSTTQGRPGVAFETDMTAAEGQAVKGLRAGFANRTPEGRLKFLEYERQKNREAMEKHNNRSILGGMWNAMFGKDEDQWSNIQLKKNALDRLQNEARGGAKFSQGAGIQENFAMLQVQGAGQRRTSQDLYEELAATVPVQLLTKPEPKKEENQGDSTMQQLLQVVSPAMAALVKLIG